MNIEVVGSSTLRRSLSPLCNAASVLATTKIMGLAERTTVLGDRNPRSNQEIVILHLGKQHPVCR
ncbi:hypothetical protein NC652_022621 [Populus alba x Populus x berolinensis]|uniref:Uncharacterized protein n=1 Tax=Populus alba x Populus x berolinensis TaxID=444605 RepID=A0AAD6MH24_9ROSI|nr:hypothetical protein NC652_022621 [Populus alba x Populus x berolinensis]KAJ6984167.1 hypothetical protein NC653_022419 [Populus alba x Populus x berolinensis]